MKKKNQTNAVKHQPNAPGRRVAQSVDRRTVEVDIWGSNSILGTWWWGQISPKQPFPKGQILDTCSFS